jgi:hypothetical protein
MYKPHRGGKVKKLLSVIGIAVAMVLALAGCGGPNWNKTNYYRPASFGENGMCYYMQTQAEADMLIREGMCQPTWRPAQAPWSWQVRYVKYYESPEYRDYYVPASSRQIYAIYTREFDSKWSREIKSAQKSAVYVDNKGNKVDGDRVQTSQFGGGVRSKGGKGIRGTNGKPVKSNADKWYKQQEKKSSTGGFGTSNGGKKSSWSNGGGYKSGSTSKNTSGWSSKSSSGGGIRTSRR